MSQAKGPDVNLDLGPKKKRKKERLTRGPAGPEAPEGPCSPGEPWGRHKGGSGPWGSSAAGNPPHPYRPGSLGLRPLSQAFFIHPPPPQKHPGNAHKPPDPRRQWGEVRKCQVPPPPPSHSEAWGGGSEKTPWQLGWGNTHRGARGTLEAGETTVTLDASVALFARLTLVTSGALGSLKEWRRQEVRREVRSH